MSLALPRVRREPSTTRARGYGLLLLVLAAAMLLGFGLSSAGGPGATFAFNTTSTAVQVSPVTVSAAPVIFALGVVCAGLGGMQLARGFGGRVYWVLGLGLACFIAAFLIWADRGNSLNLVGLLSSALLRSVPLTLGALSGVLCERSGIINIAIEGMMLIAAFTGAVAASAVGSNWIGLLAGIASGGVLGAVLGVLAIRYRVDQIIAGTVLNIFALGITSYLATRVLAENASLNNPTRFSNISIPLLSKIPIIGPIFFSTNLFAYLMYLLVALVWVALFRTRWGLRVRAVGEHPRAADTVGINPLRVRYGNVILGGMMAGLAGAYFTLGSVGRFDQDMTAGRGFIALAAMIFGRWNPVGAFAAALVFGFADALQTNLAIINHSIPSEFLLMAPYIVTILVVAGLVGMARPPAADGQPYIKE